MIQQTPLIAITVEHSVTGDSNQQNKNAGVPHLLMQSRNVYTKKSLLNNVVFVHVKRFFCSVGRILMMASIGRNV